MKGIVTKLPTSGFRLDRATVARLMVWFEGRVMCRVDH